MRNDPAQPGRRNLQAEVDKSVAMLTSCWDAIWLFGSLVLLVSMIPGLIRFPMRSYPNHWQPEGLKRIDNMTLYLSACYETATPLSGPMPSFFYLHTLCGFACTLLWICSLKTGRILRWVLDGGIQGLHLLLGFLALPFWCAILWSGWRVLPLLHPTLRILNTVEFFGVAGLVIGTYATAWKKWWIIHRIFVWGLLYSCVATIAVVLTAKVSKYAFGISPYGCKFNGYVAAFGVTAAGITRDIFHEVYKSDPTQRKSVVRLSHHVRSRAERQESRLRRVITGWFDEPLAGSNLDDEDTWLMTSRSI